MTIHHGHLDSKHILHAIDIFKLKASLSIFSLVLSTTTIAAAGVFVCKCIEWLAYYWQSSFVLRSSVSAQRQDGRCDGHIRNIIISCASTDVIARPGDTPAFPRSSKRLPRRRPGRRWQTVDSQWPASVRSVGHRSDSIHWWWRRRPPTEPRSRDTRGARSFARLSPQRHQPQFVGTFLTSWHICKKTFKLKLKTLNV